VAAAAVEGEGEKGRRRRRKRWRKGDKGRKSGHVGEDVEERAALARRGFLRLT